MTLIFSSSLSASVLNYQFEKNLFQIEVQERNPVFKHQYFFKGSEHLKIRLNTQLLTLSGEIRPRVGIPLELRISESTQSGLNLIFEQGSYLSENEPIIKSMVNWFYKMSLSPVLDANYQIRADKLLYEDNKILSQFTLGLNYKFDKNYSMNMGTTLFQRARTYLFQLGLTILL